MSEVRLDVKGFQVEAVLVFDTDDIENLKVSSNRGHYMSIGSKVGVIRTPNGDNTLTLEIKFKPGKNELWEKK